MSLNKQISPEEGRKIAMEIVRDTNLANNIQNLLVWEKHYTSPTYLQKFEGISDIIKNAWGARGLVTQTESICEWGEKNPIEVILSLYYRSLDTSLNINDFDFNQIDIKPENDYLNYPESKKILQDVHVQALKNLWILNLMEDVYKTYKDKTSSTIFNSKKSIKSMISLHKTWILEKLVNNPNFERIIWGLDIWSGVTSLIAFDISGGLDLVKDNKSLIAFITPILQLDTLKLLHEKWLLKVLSIWEGRLLMGGIKNLEYLDPEKLRNYFDNLEEWEKISSGAIETLIWESMTDKIKF